MDAGPVAPPYFQSAFACAITLLSVVHVPLLAGEPLTCVGADMCGCRAECVQHFAEEGLGRLSGFPVLNKGILQ